MNMLFTTIGMPIRLLDVSVRIFMAILIGSIIGIERERKNRPAGLRTHVLVCIAATLIAMTEQQMIYEVSSLGSSSINLSFGRLSVGVITGIGFIGAGTIMTSKSKVVGLTTAASLWCIACLGLINGMGYCLISLGAAILILVILQVLRVGERTNLNRIIKVERLSKDTSETIIEDKLHQMNIQIQDYTISFHKEDGKKYCTSRYSLIFKNKDEIIKVMSELSDIENVTAVEIENTL